MTRRVVAGLIAVGLGAAIWALWPRADSLTPSTTTQPLAAPAASEVIGTSTTVKDPVTTTTVAVSHVVETVEQAEAILRQLWFGWFEGIYNQDEGRIREVVATEHQLGLAIDQFGKMAFDRAPRLDDLAFSETEMLRTDSECLVTWTKLDLLGFSAGSTQDVHVFRWTGTQWGLFSLWSYPDDLWSQDCDAQLDS